MQPRTSTRCRLAVLVALLGPLVLVTAGTLQAQQFGWELRCDRCNAVVATATANWQLPAEARCPKCKHLVTNPGGRPSSNSPPRPGTGPGLGGNVWLLAFLAGGLMMVVVVIGGVVGLVWFLTKTQGTKRRPPRRSGRA